MIKRTGTVAAFALAGVLALSPLAFAGEKPSTGDSSHSHSHTHTYKEKHKHTGVCSLLIEAEAEGEAEGAVQDETAIGEAEGEVEVCLSGVDALLGALG